MNRYVSIHSGVEIDQSVSIVINSQVTSVELACLHDSIKGSAVAEKSVILDLNKSFTGVELFESEFISILKGVNLEILSVKPLVPDLGKVQMYYRGSSFYYQKNDGVEIPFSGGLVIELYSPSVVYSSGDICFYNSTNKILYLANKTTTGAFNTSDWDEFKGSSDNNLYGRNSADTVGEGLDYLYAAIPDMSGVVSSRDFTLYFNTLSTFNIGDLIPIGSTVYTTIINVTTAFNGSSESTLKIGDVLDDNKLLEIGDVDLSRVGIYHCNREEYFLTTTQLKGIYTANGATVGIANIKVLYINN